MDLKIKLYFYLYLVSKILCKHIIDYKRIVLSIPLSITMAARQEIKNIVATKNIPLQYGLRVGVRGGVAEGLFSLLVSTSNSRKITLIFSRGLPYI